MIQIKQILAMILLLLSANSINAQTLFGVYKSEDGRETYTTINGNIMAVIDEGVTGYFTFSGNNANGVFYSNQFLGTIFMTFDTKKIVVNSIPKQTSISYSFIRAESAISSSNYNTSTNSTSPISTSGSTQRKCGFCDGTGKCPYCNSAGQSKACQNSFGYTCTDSYCIARNHRCKDCGGTHVCSNCKGTGYK